MNRKLIVGALVIGAGFLGIGTAAANVLPDCIHEDGSGQSDCIWDGQTRGNGVGLSYAVIDGAPVYGATEAEAWGLFDATGAIGLVTATGPYEVHFAGAYYTPIVATESNEIIVWDSYGRYFLFVVVA